MIFTFAPESTVTPSFLPEAEAVVAKGGGKLRYVQLTLSDEEQERRIGDPSRAAHGKLISLELLRELRPMFKAADAAMPAPLVTVDTTALPPAEAARHIADALARA